MPMIDSDVRDLLAGADYADVYPNRVDVYARVQVRGRDGAGRPRDDLKHAGLPCTIQPATGREVDDLKAIEVDATDVARFPRDPGIGLNEKVVQTDCTPPRSYTAVRSLDEGGLGLVWCVMLNFRE